MKGKECAMLVTIGILLYINACLEAERPTEYSPLPVFLKEEASSETKAWADAADTRIVSDREGSCRLRVRVEFKGTNAGDANRHAAFIVNKKSWIDGKDGWLYYRDMLQKDETADPICLKSSSFTIPEKDISFCIILPVFLPDGLSLHLCVPA